MPKAEIFARSIEHLHHQGMSRCPCVVECFDVPVRAAGDLANRLEYRAAQFGRCPDGLQGPEDAALLVQAIQSSLAPPLRARKQLDDLIELADRVVSRLVFRSVKRHGPLLSWPSCLENASRSVLSRLGDDQCRECRPNSAIAAALQLPRSGQKKTAASWRHAHVQED